MAKRKEIGYRIFIGGRPIEELTPEEREAASKRIAQRMGETLNNWFSYHIDEYQKIPGVPVTEAAAPPA